MRRSRLAPHPAGSGSDPVSAGKVRRPEPLLPSPGKSPDIATDCCEDTSNAARKLAGAVAEIAIETDAPSRTLAAATEAARVAEYHSAGRPIVGTPRGLAAQPETPGPIEEELRSLRITSPRALWHAAALDRARQQLIADAVQRRGRRAAKAAPSLNAVAGPAACPAPRTSEARRADPVGSSP
jgi:hypothetical protein